MTLLNVLSVLGAAFFSEFLSFVPVNLLCPVHEHQSIFPLRYRLMGIGYALNVN